MGFFGVRCNGCGNETNLNNCRTLDGKSYCNNCSKNLTFTKNPFYPINDTKVGIRGDKKI